MILPEDFEKRMKVQLGPEMYSNFIHALNQDTPSSVRINPKKLHHSPNLENVPWTKYGFYLKQRPNFSSDPLWHAGYYYVQEAGSMLIEKAFQKIKSLNSQPLKVLDLCASPGGKSTHICSLLSDDDLLVANEVIQSRVGTLHENLRKHGWPNVIVCNSDSEDFVKANVKFDVILIDAPCSGEGLFRKDHEAVNHWNLDNVQTCELRQKRILDNAIQCLNEGGFIVYSTCTYNPNENSQQVEELIAKGFQKIEFEFGNEFVFEKQFYPHEQKSEGFYMALLQNTNPATNSDNKSNTSNIKKVKTVEEYSKFLNNDTEFYSFKNEILAIQSHVFEFYSNGLSKLRIHSIGQMVGTQKDKLFLPSEQLSFYQNINLSSFYFEELEHELAIQYLNRQALPIKSNNKGYVLLRFKGMVIGLGKYAGNRINNLFPNEWKLRKLPSEDEWFSLCEFFSL
jgi:16S rRNA C967 or C1407 C5-methylase (RsmB/RsmF family)/NOL1/NOP2/fmu family ribosome biogenesis protein